MKNNYGELFSTYPDLVDVNTLCEMLGNISKKLAYRLLADGSIKSVKIGRTYKIPKHYISEYLFRQIASLGSTSHHLCGSVVLAENIGTADSRQNKPCA